LLKEKVDIKNMAMGANKAKKRKQENSDHYETGKEVKKLKETVQAKLGKNYNVSRLNRN